MSQRRIIQAEYPYFVTWRTRKGFPLFTNVEYAKLLCQDIFVSAALKRYDVLAFQIMPDHIHALFYTKTRNDMMGVGERTTLLMNRTLESVRLEDNNPTIITPERTFSKVRSNNNNKYTISDLIQSIKGNFSRKLHQGNIWQKRFYTRIVNSNEYLRTVIYYIKHNPVKAGLPEQYQKRPYQWFDWRNIKRLF